VDYDYFLSSFLAVFVLTTNENYPSVTYAAPAVRCRSLPAALQAVACAAHMHMRRQPSCGRDDSLEDASQNGPTASLSMVCMFSLERRLHCGWS
jgi:hypothetical protein